MSLVDLLLLLVIAAVAGSLGQLLAGYELGGCLVSIVVGFIGAIIGLWIARTLELPTVFVISVDGESFPLIWSIIGSAVLALGLGLLSQRRPITR